MNGWTGKILKIDVGTRKVEVLPTEEYVDDYLGGRGVGLRLVYDLLRPGTKPLDPENPLIFSMGPLSGTAMPSSGRTDVTALSPQNNLRGRSNFAASSSTFSSRCSVSGRGISTSAVTRNSRP